MSTTDADFRDGHRQKSQIKHPNKRERHRPRVPRDEKKLVYDQ